MELADVTAEKTIYEKKMVSMKQYLSVFMINHYIVWLDISVHNPHTVAVIQSLSGKVGGKDVKMLN